MKKNEIDLLEEMIFQNYLDDDKMWELIDDFTERAKTACDSLEKEGIPFNDDFILEYAIESVAYDFRNTELYILYEKQMLINPGLAYHLRDYFLLAIKEGPKK